MTINENMKNRLENGKFAQALQYTDEHVTENEYNVVYALVTIFGNNPEIGGYMGDIVSAAVAKVIDGWPDAEEK